MSYENTSSDNASNLSNIIANANKVTKQELDKKQAITNQNINSLSKGVLNSITPKKNALKEFTQTQRKGQQNLYDKTGSYSLGFDAFDKKKNVFFHELIDQYSEIEFNLNNHKFVDEALGRKDLANIKNMVTVYGDAVPRILNIADKIEASIQNPTGPQLSVTGAPPYQLQIITKLKNGEDIDIHNDGNSIILTDPNGKEGERTLNVEEFNRAFGDAKNPYLKYEAEIEKPLNGAFTNYMKDNEGNFTARYTTPVTKSNARGDGDVEITTMTQDQQVDLKNAMIGIENKKTGVPDGMFTDLILKDGESIWEDLMDGGRGYKIFTDKEMQGEALEWLAGKDGIPIPGEPNFDLYERQYNTMLDYLSNRALQENAAAEGIELDTEDRAPVKKNDQEEVIEIQEDFNVKWNALASGESLVGPDERKYTKK